MFDEETQKALMAEFFAENGEALNRIERGMLQLEANPADSEQLNAVFRDMHTVKGNCRMMEFQRLEELTHTAETLLDRLRDGKAQFNQRIGSVLLAVLDAVRAVLEEIVRGGNDETADFSQEHHQLQQLLDETDGASVALDLEADDGDDETAPGDTASDRTTPGGATESSQLDSVRLSIDRLDTLMSQIGELGATFNHLRYLIGRDPEQVNQLL
ncbi:MAG: Hpt domain-containing protein, partial [Magnetococcales bacterium]|nr:Hpt domain-containing protein [Magnetococcales bacterium]